MTSSVRYPARKESERQVRPPSSKTDIKLAEDEINEMLASLTPEELERLNSEVDPDDSYLPARDRVRNQTEKVPTSPFDRTKLINFIEDQARNEKDWPNIIPFKKETKGKVWKPKTDKTDADRQEADKTLETEFDITTAEWDEVVKHATEPELAELAAILNMTGLVTQSEYYKAQKNEKLDQTSWSATVKAEELKYFPPEPDNDTDIDDVIAKGKANSPEMTSINLNNMKDLKAEQLLEVIKMLENNTCVDTLYMCNVSMTDALANEICRLLEVNKTLVSVNLESNRFTGQSIMKLVKSTLKNQIVKCLRLENQRTQVLGHQYENEIADDVSKSTSLLRLGLHFDCYRPRVVVAESLKRNMDTIRIKRQESQTGNIKDENI